MKEFAITIIASFPIGFSIERVYINQITALLSSVAISNGMDNDEAELIIKRNFTFKEWRLISLSLLLVAIGVNLSSEDMVDDLFMYPLAIASLVIFIMPMIKLVDSRKAAEKELFDGK